MAHLALRRLVGAALVDRDLYDGLMNGQRSALMAEFDLTDEERQVVVSFDAGSPRDLAYAAHTWLKEQTTPVSPTVTCGVAQIA